MPYGGKAAWHGTLCKRHRALALLNFAATSAGLIDCNTCFSPTCYIQHVRYVSHIM